MTCEYCEDLQDIRGPTLGPNIYVRIGNSNVEIIGCDEHIKELMALIALGRAAQEFMGKQ